VFLFHHALDVTTQAWFARLRHDATPGCANIILKLARQNKVGGGSLF
jgi:hypothetical protein